MKTAWGRSVYGLAAIGAGLCAFAFHDLSALGSLSHRALFITLFAGLEIIGGVAVQGSRTARAGAVAIGVVYFAIALLGIRPILAHPAVYNGFGNFFEQFSFVAGAAILFACADPTGRDRPTRVARFGYYSFGLCLMSFALEQLVYLSQTARLVPTWIPPGQMFWAITTTAAFGLAALALLTGVMARVASRLTTAMILGFGVLVWLPALAADPHSFVNWAEATETLGIAASAWLVADVLGRRPSGSSPAIRG